MNQEGRKQIEFMADSEECKLYSCATSSSSSSLAIVQARIDYKLSAICHNFFSDLSPAYLSGLLTVYTHSRQLSSSADTWTLHIPHVNTKTLGQCSFSYSAPKQWNSLPLDIRHIQSSHTFKTALNSHLYKQ